MASAVQNVNAPLPLPAHLAFCAIATLLYIVQYSRKKENYYLYLLIAIDLTILTQFFEQDYVIYAIAIVEVILIVMAFVSSMRVKCAERKRRREEERLAQMEKGESDAAAFTVDVKKVSETGKEPSEEEAEADGET